MGGVLQCKREAWDGRSTDSISLYSERRGTGSTAIQIGAYCNTNGRCIAILFREVVVVGVSDILLNFGKVVTEQELPKMTQK